MRLIDADALAKFIDYGHLNNPNEKLYSENDIREMIDMMPTAGVVPVKHGKWIPIKRGENGYSAGDFRCSICKKANPCRHLTAYCPNCGARMDEERKEE